MSIKLNHPSLLRQASAWLGGQWVGADSGATFNVRNPASGETIARVPLMGRAETERAITFAATAQKQWRALAAKERSAHLKKWFALVMLHQEDLAHILTAEQGKPLAEARGEIAYGASFIEWFAEEAKRVYGEVIPSPLNDRRLVVLKQPIGVTAAITPWNFPTAMITRKAAPALAAGCTMIVKPAEQTPLSALALAVLAGRGRDSGWRVSGDYRGCAANRCSHLRKPGGDQVVIYRFDRSGTNSDAPECGYDQEAVAGTGRECALYRVRRCGSGRSGRRRHGQQISQRGTDLRVRQPAVRAGRRV